MTLDPLIHAPFIVQAHVATVVPAALLGAWLIAFSRKGLRWHRALGAMFLILMVTTAIIALFIHRRMPASPVLGMSPTHLFVPFVLFASWRGRATSNSTSGGYWVSSSAPSSSTG